MTDYKVALSFEDGVTRFINVADDQTVADAAYRQRINIPVDCNDGACGTCKAFCESGEFDPGSYVEDALSAEEAAEGYVLACQARPKSDMVLQIACTSAVAKTQSATFTGTLTEVHHFSPTVTRLRMKIPNRDKLAYLPGQYVNITIPRQRRDPLVLLLQRTGFGGAGVPDQDRPPAVCARSGPRRSRRWGGTR